MRKISATWIFPGNLPPLKNGILICEDDGTVVDLIDTGGQLREQAGLEQYSGILVPGFVNAHCHLENIYVGTDSLASNHNLSILQEMITIQNHFPEITLQELVEWGSLNGSRALGLTDFFGSFDPGKKPGVNLITGADLQQLKLTEKSKIKKLM